MIPVCQNVPTSFPKCGRPCFESSSPEPWPYHSSHGYPYPYQPCCCNNSFHYYPGFQYPPFFTPQPMPLYGDHYPYSEMHNFYPPRQHMDPTRAFGNDAEKPRSCYLYGHPMHSRQHMSYPYPFMWVPPEFMKNEELENPQANIVKSDKESSGVAHHPNARDGCFPIDMNTLSTLLESEKEKGGQHEEGKGKFLFPSFLMPFYQEQTGNSNGEKKISSDDAPYTIKFIPLNQSGKEGTENNSKSEGIQKGSSKNENIECSGGKGRRGSSDDAPYTIKFIPLNQSGKDGTENNSKSEGMQKGSSKNENIECSGGKGRRGSTSPPKTSNLAPVCLRVDPLPRKRSQTRSSSPSASGARENNSNRQMEPDREKIVQVVDEKKSEGRLADENRHPASNNSKEAQQLVKQELKSQGVVETITEPRTKKVWSDAKAAELIQSVYRGYTVRKWDPLKKLKQLSEVKKEVENVRSRVERLQSNHPEVEKEKIMISELIMRLLLKLDTIQGLLPFVRDVRKCLAKELVILQGMVDEICVVPSGQSTEENVPSCEEKCSGEVIEVPIMGNVVDEGQHLILDYPSNTLGSDDEKTTCDKAASNCETTKDVEEAGVMANVTIADGESKLEESSCVAAGEDTVAVDVVSNGQTVLLEDGTFDSSQTNIVKHDGTEVSVGPGEGVLMTSKPEEEEAATMEEPLCKKLTPITGDTDYNKVEEQDLEVESPTLDSMNITEAKADPALEQNHPENDLIQVVNDSTYGQVINDVPINVNETAATGDDLEASESVKSDTVQLADVFKEVITSEEQQLEEAGAGEEGRSIALHAEFQVEEYKEAREPKGESESTEEERGGEEDEAGRGKKVKENEELKEMLERLMQVGKEQVNLISNLSCRVKHLEKELKNKKMKRKMPRAKGSPNRV